MTDWRLKRSVVAASLLCVLAGSSAWAQQPAPPGELEALKRMIQEVMSQNEELRRRVRDLEAAMTKRVQAPEEAAKPAAVSEAGWLAGPLTQASSEKFWPAPKLRDGELETMMRSSAPSRLKPYRAGKRVGILSATSVQVISSPALPSLTLKLTSSTGARPSSRSSGIVTPIPSG